MATVYAAVTSLMGTIQLISQSTSDLQEDHKEHLKLLYDKVGSMLEFLDTNSDDEPMRDLLKKVKDVAHKVEDEVESHIWRGDHKTLLKILQRVFHLPTKAHERLLKILQRAIEEVDSVKEELNKLKDNNNNNNMRAGNFSLGGSSSPRLHVSTLENNMVGHNIEQELMRGQLTGHSSQLEVISIAGMGGIGKSTFAKRMFNDPSIVSFFDVRGWVTVSKDYNLRKMLLSLLQDAGVNAELDKKSDIGEHREEEEGEGGGGGGGGQEEEGNLKKKKKKISDVQLANRMQKSDGELADRLQKSLKGRRYLIVVDDIWSTEAWDEFRLWFPEYNNRSRILLTTRDIKVAQYASYPRDPSPMRFLKPEESWTLFCQKAFDQKVCPIEFENIAREVVKNCNGLPLMISVVAGALSSKRTVDEWRKVAQSVSSLVNLDDYQRCSRVLALSYNHLPSHLKACFLYFGVFPKASEISVKKLIRLWVAEGFLELKGFEGLEKVATSLLSNLIDKSLVVVGKRSLNDKIKTCRIHDLLHDFCLREAENENLLYVTETPVTTYEGSRKVSSQVRRWVSVYPKDGSFPPNLKKLTLCCTFLLWKDMTIVSMLPKLEVLQLRNNAFVPNIGWKVTEMQFPKLKFLLLEQLNIKYWRATDDCFPCLERIIIRNCRFLIEIPQEFADSMTLQLIELHQCYPSLVNSAELIQKEQLESLGNNMLKVYAFDTIKWRIWEE
ncbi:putative late blight resistance protein homolog R1A-10 isoform X2 [Nicotiana tomentosiformis]|uniref:putative late blight resistance protein homolog R1A-10 isoform X2 n=1 Tax=Nicotiana tomentosiformis TaxID=4098 RepID=UPI00388C705D